MSLKIECVDKPPAHSVPVLEVFDGGTTIKQLVERAMTEDITLYISPREEGDSDERTTP